MNWIKKLFRKNTPESHSEKVSTSYLELRCTKCNSRYSVGEDAVIVTMDMAKALFDKVITLKSDDPSSVIRKDLVSFVSGVPADRRTSVLTQARETVRSLQASLKNGQKRVWICFQCKELNDYPYENEPARISSSLSSAASSQTVKVIVSDNKAALNTALSQAAEAGNFQAAKDSIDAGADVNVTLSTGATPLMLATFDGHTDIVRLLLEKGANPNCTLPGKKVTALMIAAQNNHIEIAKLLLEKDVDINATTADGIDAKLIAEKNGHMDILGLLNVTSQSEDEGFCWRSAE